MTMDPAAPRQPVTYRRRMRNYLLDSRFQLKYTGFLVGVALLISGVTGAVLHSTTRAVVSESSALVDESRKVSEVSRMNIRDLASDSPELLATFNREADAHDRLIAAEQASLLTRQGRMLASLVGGLALMVTFIGLLGIYFTHKVAGPIYKMKGLLKRVGEGSLRIDSRLRRGDELQDFFDTFIEMVSSLRQIEERRLSDVEMALVALEAGQRDEAKRALGRVRETMRTALQPSIAPVPKG